MKHLKTFEAHYFNNYKHYTIDDISIGDYVKANYGTAMDKNVVDFLDTHFGKVVFINKNKDTFEVAYKYEEVPENIRNYFTEIGWMKLLFNISGLIEFAPTKEELELKLSANKYNI